FNQDLYPSTGVPLAASSSTSAGSHSPCSPLLPPSLSSNVAAAAAAQTSALSSSTSNTTIPTIPLGALQRHITKEEDISTVRSDNEDLTHMIKAAKCRHSTRTCFPLILFSFECYIIMYIMLLSQFPGTIPGAHNDSSCSSGPESPNNLHHQDGSGGGASGGASGATGGSSSGETSGGGGGGGRAQYVSATCVVFTHYSGDAASVVDEHFSRALNFSDKNNK
ncbi:AAEL003263-PA, partial [Aedes aegypti]